MFVVLFPADAAANISASRTSTGFDLAGIEHPVGRSRSALYSQRKRQTGSRKKNKRAEAGGDSASFESSYKLSSVSNYHAEARAATVTDFGCVFSPKILFP